MTEAKVCLKLGSLSFSAATLSEGVAEADWLLESFVGLDLDVSALCTFGPTCWKNFGMTGRQLMTIPVESSAYVHMPICTIW